MMTSSHGKATRGRLLAAFTLLIYKFCIHSYLSESNKPVTVDPVCLQPLRSTSTTSAQVSKRKLSRGEQYLQMTRYMQGTTEPAINAALQGITAPFYYHRQSIGSVKSTSIMYLRLLIRVLRVMVLQHGRLFSTKHDQRDNLASISLNWAGHSHTQSIVHERSRFIIGESLSVHGGSQRK